MKKSDNCSSTRCELHSVAEGGVRRGAGTRLELLSLHPCPGRHWLRSDLPQRDLATAWDSGGWLCSCPLTPAIFVILLQSLSQNLPGIMWAFFILHCSLPLHLPRRIPYWVIGAGRPRQPSTAKVWFAPHHSRVFTQDPKALGAVPAVDHTF